MNPVKKIVRETLRRSSAVLLAMAATLLALPVNAGISLPTSPLTTASRVPPNILFILDDSGSMVWDFMPGPFDSRAFNNNGSLATTPVNISYDAYTRNTLSYNPNIDYQPWTLPNRSLMTGGTSYTAAYSSDNLASGSTTNLSNSTRTFYVPKSGITNEADARQYYRYQIVSTSEIVRSEYGTVTGSNTNAAGFPKSGLSASTGNQLNYSFSIPAGLATLTVSISGGSGDADLYVRRGSAPTTGSYDCRPYLNGNNETCTFNSPAAGTYHVGIRAYSSFNNVSATAVYSTSNRCGTGNGSSDWINCTSATPTGRTVADELRNYATWYSYHRTRIKVAKAGAGAAFGEMGADVRVGYRTIWNRSNFDIPVFDNQGVFADVGTANNRTTWYNRLYAAQGNNGTPLRDALDSAGQYFSRSDSAGPYGPESGSDQLACRQNFTILTTDGYWNSDSSSVGNQDGSNGSAIARPDGSTYTYIASAPYRDNHSNTLADIAMRYWKTDLRAGLGGLDNIVPTTNANPAFWQHMVTFGISIGLQGTVDPNVPANFNSWPNPIDAEDDHRIDDLLHASINGRGKFVAASNPLSFTQGLKSALAAITERTGSFSNVSANSATLDTGTQLFKASYVSGSWTGDLVGYARNADNTDFESSPSWRASDGIPTANRRIFTMDGTAGATFPTSAQVTALNRSNDQYPVDGTNNAAYIAGARNLEIQSGGHLRNRVHLLGDIVSSSPVYMKETGTIFVGANDGMLHAFSADTGAELFAYIPSAINWTDLGTFSRPDYGHRYFVDGPLVVSTREQTPDQNILVGTLGKGGKGIFALNVTNPSAFEATHVKWERTETPGGNMGLVQGKPVIARLNNGVTAVVVGNGVNSSTGHAALLIYNLDTGVLIRELDTGVGSALLDHPDSNGLSAPVGWDRDGNGTMDAVYAGDMLGNVWKFDLSAISPASWAVANSGNPLFTAVGPDGTSRQPISGSLTVGMHPTTYRTWVFFGTGRFMTTGDVTNQSVQSLYGIVDQGATVAKADLTQRSLVVLGTREGKPVRGFERNTPLPVGSKGWYVNLVDSPQAAASGERVVTGPQMSGSVLVVSSIIPTADACQPDGRGYINALDAFTGTSAVSPYFDVDGDGVFSNETLNVGSGQNAYAVPIGSVDMGVGMVTQSTLFSGSGGGGGQACAAGSTGNMDCVGTDEMRNVGRVSWREVIRN